MRKVYKNMKDAEDALKRHKKRRGKILVRHRDDDLYELVARASL